MARIQEAPGLAGMISHTHGPEGTVSRARNWVAICAARLAGGLDTGIPKGASADCAKGRVRPTL
eukprot:1265796-Alexandrium_andersonii.AAC.1